MNVRKCIAGAVSVATLLLAGLSPIFPAHAQGDGTVRKGRVIIRTPQGEQEIELNGDELPDLGEGNHVLIMRAGPNGVVESFVGSPESFNVANGGGLAYNLPGIAGPNGGALAGLNVIDPGTSYLYALLKRIDVAQEIHLNARQREALEAAETSAHQARQAQMKQSVEAFVTTLRGANADELKQALHGRAQQMQDQAKSFADARMKTLAAILRPEQLARLRELDFQYRGPLAMGVSDVAQQAALNKDQADGVTGLLREYRQEVRRNLSFTRTAVFKQGAGGRAAQAPSPPLNSEEMRVKLVKADREIRKSRVVLGGKALASLPDAQRAQWSKLQGKPFEFHPAL
jgi:hypothetical protein